MNNPAFRVCPPAGGARSVRARRAARRERELSHLRFDSQRSGRSRLVIELMRAFAQRPRGRSLAAKLTQRATGR
jgi:hypothetical protein